MTVEACLIVPFCFFALLSLLCPFQILLKKNCIQAEMFRAAQSYGAYGEKVLTVKTLAKEGVLLQWKEENGEKLCYVEYKLPVPFAGIGIGQLNCYQQMVVADYQGISMVPEGGEEGYVYLAENSRVCHLQSDCTYLKIKIRTVTFAEIKELRNQSGEIYYPCESCIQNQMINPLYITSYGTRYHSKKDCSKIQRNVRKVLRSQIGSMPVCSKCQSETSDVE